MAENQHSCLQAPSTGYFMLIGPRDPRWSPMHSWPCIKSSGILEISKVSRTGRRGDPASGAGMT